MRYPEMLAEVAKRLAGLQVVSCSFCHELTLPKDLFAHVHEEDGMMHFHNDWICRTCREAQRQAPAGEAKEQ